jgi:hypothetical protein
MRKVSVRSDSFDRPNVHRLSGLSCEWELTHVFSPPTYGEMMEERNR